MIEKMSFDDLLLINSFQAFCQMTNIALKAFKKLQQKI